MPDSKVDQYAVFGNPIAHSKSPAIHGMFAKQTDQAMQYKAVLVEEGRFNKEATSFFAEKCHMGLNITVPFKLQAFDFADILSDRAKFAGAVNTLHKRDSQIFGDNTDGVGMVRDIRNNLRWQIKNQKILLLGAGGAVRGVLGPLLDELPKSITIANRTLNRAKELASLFSGYRPDIAVSTSSFEELEDQFDLIINGTSASLKGDLPPLSDSIVTTNSCCYDMMYAKEKTVFLQWAEKQGVTRSADGLGMLIEQAAESFFIWREVRPLTGPVLKAIRQQL